MKLYYLIIFFLLLFSFSCFNKNNKAESEVIVDSIFDHRKGNMNYDLDSLILVIQKQYKNHDCINVIKNSKRILDRDSSNAFAYYTIGYCLSSSGLYYQSIKYFNKTIELRYRIVDSYYNNGWNYYMSENYEMSIKYYQKVLELKPDDKDAQAKLNMVLDKMEF